MRYLPLHHRITYNVALSKYFNIIPAAVYSRRDVREIINIRVPMCIILCNRNICERDRTRSVARNHVRRHPVNRDKRDHR